MASYHVIDPNNNPIYNAYVQQTFNCNYGLWHTVNNTSGYTDLQGNVTLPNNCANGGWGSYTVSGKGYTTSTGQFNQPILGETGTITVVLEPCTSTNCQGTSTPPSPQPTSLWVQIKLDLEDFWNQFSTVIMIIMAIGLIALIAYAVVKYTPKPVKEKALQTTKVAIAKGSRAVTEAAASAVSPETELPSAQTALTQLNNSNNIMSLPFTQTKDNVISLPSQNYRVV